MESNSAAEIRRFATAIKGEGLAGIVPRPRSIEAFSPSNQWYVNVAGDDKNPCSHSAPCRQINRALEVAKLGDLISVGPGDFDSFSLTGPLAGPEEKELVIRGHGNQTVIHRHGDEVAAAISLSQVSNIWIEELTLQIDPAGRRTGGPRGHSSSGAAVEIVESSGVWLHGVSINGASSSGIRVTRSSKIDVERCFIGGAGTLSSGIRMKDAMLVRVADSVFEGGEYGIQATAHELEDPLANTSITIERNRFLDQSQAAVYLGGVRHSSLVNNVVIGAGQFGMRLVPGLGSGERAEAEYLIPAGIKIYHNTIVAGVTSEAALAVELGGIPSEEIKVSNNILLSENTDLIGTLYWDGARDIRYVNSDYNLIVNVRAGTKTEKMAASEFAREYRREKRSVTQLAGRSVASQFADYPGRNFELAPNSAAENRGNPVAPVRNDHLRRFRGNSDQVDIGAYERKN